MKNILEELDPVVLGEELKHARNKAGMTQEEVSKLLDVARTTVTAIEKGERRIRPDELIKLSEAFNKSVHEFLRVKKPIESFQVQFRAAYKRSEKENDEMNSIIDEFEELCRDYLELEELVYGMPWQNYPVEYKITGSNIEQSAESIAIRERNRLGLGDGPIPMLRDILEQDIGLRIFYLKMPANFSEMYNYHDYLGGCMAVNANHPEVRRRWSMSHGYAHFLVHRKGPVVDSEEKHVRLEKNEQFADAFSKHFLMPANSILKKYDDIKKSKNKFTIADLFITAHYYGVSLEAMTRRLEEMKLIDLGTWEKLKSHNIRIKEEQKKLNIEELPQRDDMLPVRYQYLALYAFEKGMITEGQFAKFLRKNRVEARDFVMENQFEIDDDLELEQPLSVL
ncbi:MAG: XRE family transcriptional regulator [Balneolaceae bacterium]|nr:XRE family transcriptional regulator [Balneolaceae bacterium]